MNPSSNFDLYASGMYNAKFATGHIFLFYKSFAYDHTEIVRDGDVHCLNHK